MQKQQTKTKVKKRHGRPSVLDTIDYSMVETLTSFSLTDVQLAQVFRVSEQTINAWKKDVQFSLALKRGKSIADTMVERSLFERAMGYSHPEEEIHIVKGKVVRVQLTKHYPPDSTSMIFWLKNRQPDRWRDKVDLEHDIKKDGLIDKFLGLSEKDIDDRLRELTNVPASRN